MGTLRRWTATLLTSFDGIVQNIENHEAIVASAIREAEESGTRAKVQLQRVRRDGQTMRQRLVELQEQATLWKERAKRAASSEEARAIECLRRSKRYEEQLAALELQEREHAKLERDLAKDLQTIDDRLTTLRQQRNAMRTRQSRAEALKLIQQVDSTTVREIDDIFARWESQVAACEARVGTAAPDDELAAQMADEEEELALRAELEQLKSSLSEG